MHHKVMPYVQSDLEIGEAITCGRLNFNVE